MSKKESGNGDRDGDTGDTSNTKSLYKSYQPSLPSSRADLIGMLASKVVKVGLQNVERPLQSALDKLPKDAESVRALPFYNSTLEVLRFQRDQYLVGPKYAKRQETQRHRRVHPPRPSAPFVNLRRYQGMPFEAAALGHIQIVNVGASFVPSETVRKLLLPIVVDLPSGVLREPIVNTVSNAIPLAQPVLDRAVKNALLNFMDDPTMRQVIKNRTQRILRVDDEDQEGGGGGEGLSNSHQNDNEQPKRG